MYCIGCGWYLLAKLFDITFTKYIATQQQTVHEANLRVWTQNYQLRSRLKSTNFINPGIVGRKTGVNCRCKSTSASLILWKYKWCWISQEICGIIFSKKKYTPTFDMIPIAYEVVPIVWTNGEPSSYWHGDPTSAGAVKVIHPWKR